jgi:hypothetical protein
MVSPSAQLRVGWVRITVYEPLQFGTSDLHGGIAVLKSGLPETDRGNSTGGKFPVSPFSWSYRKIRPRQGA